MTKTVTRHKSWMVMSCSNIVDHFDYIRQQHPFKDDMHLSIDVKTNKKALYFLIKSCVNLSVTDFFCFQLRRWPSSQPPLHVCNLSGGDWSSSETQKNRNWHLHQGKRVCYAKVYLCAKVSLCWMNFFFLLCVAEQRVSSWGGSNSDPVYQHAVVQRVGELCEGQRQWYDE